MMTTFEEQARLALMAKGAAEQDLARLAVCPPWRHAVFGGMMAALVASPAAPLALPVGGFSDSGFLLEVYDYEECLALAASDGRQDAHFDSTFRVTWPLGETQCGARLICEPPGYSDDCDLNPEACPVLRPPTRDEGFFKTRPQALGACLAGGVARRRVGVGRPWGRRTRRATSSTRASGSRCARWSAASGGSTATSGTATARCRRARSLSE